MGINWRVRTKPLAFWLGIAGAAATPVLAYLGLGYEAIPRAWAARGATDPARHPERTQVRRGRPPTGEHVAVVAPLGGHNNERLAVAVAAKAPLGNRCNIASAPSVRIVH